MNNRNVIACKLFFVNNIRKYVMHYVDRWRGKIGREKRMMKFADSLERKLRICIESDTFNRLFRCYYHGLNEELSSKLSKFADELDSASNDFNSFSTDTDVKIADMRKKSETNK
jgi:hypothetical protein